MRPILFAALPLLIAGTAQSAEPKILISFQSMYGVDGPFLGKEGAIRGIAGDELPWEVGAAEGRLTTAGHLQLRVRGVVFADDPAVPPELVGTNDEPTFRAAVSCLSEDPSTGEMTNINVISDPFPATKAGNSDIDAMLVLPDECIAPLVFILSGSEPASFAISGGELGE